MTQQQVTDLTLTFGKYKGKKLSEVPADYVKWLSEQLFICGKQDVPQAARAFLESQPAKMPHFTGYQSKYGGYYVSVDEQESAWEQEQIEKQQADDLRRECCVLEWTASSGQAIEVWVSSAESVMVSVDGKDYNFCSFKPVPAAQAARAKAMGIVCQLGPIGLTAERKAIVEAAIRKYQK